MSESMDRIADELLYTRSGFLAQKLANQFADSIKPVIVKGHGIKNEQTAFWEKETETQAGVAACNFVLDELAQDVSEAKVRSLREVNSGWRDREARESSEYRLYFSQPLSALVRMAAESQAMEMEPWISLLEKETSAEMQELVPRIKKAIDDTHAAVKARNEAASATAVHRVRTIEPFIMEVNAFRTRHYANLLTVTQDNRLPKSWADIFFRPLSTSISVDENLPGMSSALLTVLNAKGLKPTDEQLKKIVSIKDTALLKLLLVRACTAATIDEVIKEII
jgi:hypothetical protein